MNDVEREAVREDAIASAVDAGVAAGLEGADPVVLHDTNNVVVWLRPHEVVAKVGVQPHSAEVLEREVAICAQMSSVGAPVPAPRGGIRSAGHRRWPVSLWKRIHPSDASEVSNDDLSSLLPQVHDALRGCSIDLPGYEEALRRTRATMQEDGRLGDLSSTDVAMLRGALDDWMQQAAALTTVRQPIHGDPHPANVMATAAGPILIDFESACTGPREWDLSAMPPGVAKGMVGIDPDLLHVLRLLRSVVVATWCRTRSDVPQMRAHAEHHLRIVSAARS